MRICPKCGSTQSEPKARIIYDRECDNCHFIGPVEAFEEPEPAYSWHAVDHGNGIAYEVIQVIHWPGRLEVESVRTFLTEPEALEMIDVMRTAAPRQGRKLAYP